MNLIGKKCSHAFIVYIQFPVAYHIKYCCLEIMNSPLAPSDFPMIKA